MSWSAYFSRSLTYNAALREQKDEIRTVQYPRPKRIGQRSLLGELGVYIVGSIVMRMGFVWYPTGSLETGIDGHIELRDETTEEAFGTFLAVQSKAVKAYFQNETSTGFDFYCDERDIDYWLKGNLPVLLVVSRPSTEEAFWVSIKDYFRDPASRSSRKVHFDKAKDRFDETCREALFRIGAPRDSGLYLAPVRRTETLISNLLPIAFLPGRLYLAETRFRQRRQLGDEARRLGVEIGGEWVLNEKRVLSFRDLSRGEWAQLCDQGTVEDFAVEEWSATSDPSKLRDFVELLRSTLRAMVRSDLDYHRKLDLLYFRATRDLSQRDVDYRSLTNTADRTVFKAYTGDDGSVKYYRHSAFHDRFHRFDGNWYLEVSPTYHFTTDGYRLRFGYERFLKRIKEIEGHEAVRGQLVMWVEYLTPRLSPMLGDDPYPFMGFFSALNFQVDRGIDDSAWKKTRMQAPKASRGRRMLARGEIEMERLF